jgi:hypothetical protein
MVSMSVGYQKQARLYVADKALAWSRRRNHLKIREAWVRTETKALQKPKLTAPSYKLVAMKLVSPSKEHLEKHYADLSDKPFFKGLVTCTPS